VPQRRLRAIGILDQRGEGVEGLSDLRERHVSPLKAEPADPPERSSLAAFRLVIGDKEGYSQGVVKADGRKVRGLGSHRCEVTSIEGVLEPAVRTPLDRHERMFALLSRARTGSRALVSRQPLL